MKEICNHAGQQRGRVVLYHLLLWLVFIFSLGETPIGRGGFLSDSESRPIDFLEELRATLCRPRVVTTHISTDTELTACHPVTQKAFAAQNTNSASATSSSTETVERQGRQATFPLPAFVVRQKRTIAFSSRAPPSFA